MFNESQQKNLRSLWDKLSFARYIDVTLDLSPERCLNRLLRVDQTKYEDTKASRIAVERGKTTADAYEV